MKDEGVVTLSRLRGEGAVSAVIGCEKQLKLFKFPADDGRALVVWRRMFSAGPMSG